MWSDWCVIRFSACPAQRLLELAVWKEDLICTELIQLDCAPSKHGLPLPANGQHDPHRQLYKGWNIAGATGPPLWCKVIIQLRIRNIRSSHTCCALGAATQGCHQATCLLIQGGSLPSVLLKSGTCFKCKLFCPCVRQ